MIFAAIDIGSNAVRLLFSNVIENEKGRIISSKATFIRVPLRLGDEVFATGKVHQASIDKLIQTLQAFKQLIPVFETHAYRICATEAMREAANKEDVVAQVWEKVGMRIEIIDGLEEASAIRAAGEQFPKTSKKISMFMDVGGGSTEIAIMQEGEKGRSRSFKLGTIRILQQCEPKGEWEALEEWIHQYKKQFGKIMLVGSGGNINKLTKLFGDRTHFQISYSQLKKAHETLCEMSMEERMESFGLRADRADVIVPAAKLFLYIMKLTKTKKIQVPKFGLADGMVCQLYLQHKSSKNA